ncbi:MAG: mannose-1-phosphate guanyltransferase [Candidatus Kapaibacteriales bacterium]
MYKAVIMAGGFGTRLRPLTMEIPKPMVPILGEPMMGHITNSLRETGIKDIVSVLYFLPEVIQEHFGNGKEYGVEMGYVMANADFGTAGAVKNAESVLKGNKIIIISGDVLTDFDLSKALEYHETKGADATIVLTRVGTPLEYGIVMTSEDGRIERFLEKPSWGQVFSDTINTGIYILEPHVLDMIPEKTEYDFSKDLFPDMLEKEMGLYGYTAEGYWRDVGNLNEYHHGQLDSLHGQVNLPQSLSPKKKIKSDKIHPDAELTGENVIGEGTIIESGARISNCVIGDNCHIGEGAVLSGATLWDRVTIGKHTHLSEDVLCSDVTIWDRVTVAENVFISHNCIIGSGCRLFSNIKLWPNKTVEEDSILTTSLVSESKWDSKLFTDARIGGESNIEMNPEFGAKLGACFGNTIGAGSRIIASRDPDSVSRIMKRSIVAGLLSVGVDVNDLRQMSVPQSRQEINTGKYDGGFHVRRSPRNPENLDIIIFSSDGRDIPISTTKKIERFFYGEDINRVHYDSVGHISYPERTNEIYLNRFMETIDKTLLSSSSPRVLMDYSYGLASGIFPMILGKLGVKSLSLHDYIDGKRFHEQSELGNIAGDDIPDIMKSLNYKLGFKIEPGAEKISVINENGEWHRHVRLLTLITALFLNANKDKDKYKIAVSILGESTIERLAEKAGVGVVRIKNNHSAMMEATRDPEVKFVGGIYGGFIFSNFLKASDGMYSVAKILEMLSKTDTSLGELDSTIAKRYQKSRPISCGWKQKGSVMRKAMEYTQSKKRELVEGVKFYLDDEYTSWVLLLPSKENAEFSVYAESDNAERSNELVDIYSHKVKEWAEAK